ncbi:phosphotransferase [Vineibacter terrae]|uniref:phosphotransferase n=1 Tax=Vineibacter terrae TaxID=2586908 RepID=UPI002E324C76|nr:phosphotransferase [Vineibacter terrae]HEX2890402.1 phosphotransferase [Vineibacter terrae]
MATLPRECESNIAYMLFSIGEQAFCWIIRRGNGRLTGIIDWELAGIGAQALDVGWSAMLADSLC